MMAWAEVWDRVARADRVKVVLAVSRKAVRARAWLMAVVAWVTIRATARMDGDMARVAAMAMVEAVRNMAGAVATALFREAGAKAGRDTDAAGTMIAKAVIARFREVVVKDTDQVLIMVEAEKATALARVTVVDTPVARIFNEVDRDTDAVDRTMVRAARAIAAVATSNRVSIITTVPLP